VESPRGSTLKFKYDPERSVITLARPLPAGLVYPFDWGFVPSTEGPDGDPVDAFVLWDASSYPGIVLTCRAIGVLRVEQNSKEKKGRERNDRIAAMTVAAARWESIRSVRDLSTRMREEVEQFFLASVAFEKKDAKILGWAGPREALALVRTSRAPGFSAPWSRGRTGQRRRLRPTRR